MLCSLFMAHTVLYLITTHTLKWAQSSNFLIVRLQPMCFYLLLSKSIFVGTHLNCLDLLNAVHSYFLISIHFRFLLQEETFILAYYLTLLKFLVTLSKIYVHKSMHNFCVKLGLHTKWAVYENCFEMDEIKFTLFLSNNGFSHFELHNALTTQQQNLFYNSKFYQCRLLCRVCTYWLHSLSDFRDLNKCIAPEKAFFLPKRPDIYLTSPWEHMLWYLLEAPWWGTSNKYPHH